MLRMIDRLLQLTWAERKLLAAAFFSIWAARICLWILPFETIRALAERDLTARDVPSDKRPSVAMIIRSIQATSRYVPQATCLIQALAGKMLCAAFGHKVCLKIGVGKDQEGKFRAHAWLEQCGRIILGRSDGDYTLLLSWSKS
jgi:Transglutaminase-like superfamily